MVYLRTVNVVPCSIQEDLVVYPSYYTSFHLLIPNLIFPERDFTVTDKFFLILRVSPGLGPLWLFSNKEPTCQCRRRRSGRSSEEGNGNPLQYSCLENPMDRGAWQATVHGAAKRHDLWTEQPNNNSNQVL